MRALVRVTVPRRAATRSQRRIKGAMPRRHGDSNLISKSRYYFADQRGASAVEFALVVLPFLMLGLGILQFLLFNYTQQMLSDALYSTASSPEAEVISGNKPGYVSKLCAKIGFQSDCLNATTGVRVELMRLADLPATGVAITGATFSPGSANDVLVLRAKMPAPQVISFIPQMTASDSVIFRR